MSVPSKKEREEAIASLRELLKPGDTVYTTVKHVSRSGMSRVIDVHVIKDNEPRWIGYTVAKATGMPFDDRRQGVKVGGCGMDMGFHLVYELSYTLFPNGFECVGESNENGRYRYCPANDHSNGDRNYEPHPHPNAGGYALKQQWL